MPLLPYLDAGEGTLAHPVPLASGEGARALAGALQDVSRASQHIKGAYDRSQLRTALADSAIALGEAQDEIRASGDYVGAEEKFSKAIQQQRSRAGAGLQGEYAQEFNQQLAVLGAGETLRLRDWSRQQLAGEVQAGAIADSKKWVSRFADTGETAFLDQAAAGIQAAAADGGFTSVQAHSASEAVLDQAAEDRSAVLIQRDPVSAEQAFKSDPFFDRITESKRAVFIERAQAEAAERQRVALQQMQWQEARDRLAATTHDNENFNRVIDMGGMMSPEEIDALDWRDADARVRALAWNQQQIAQTQSAAAAKSTSWGYYQKLNNKTPEQLLATRIDPNLLSDTDARYWFKEQRMIRESGADASVTSMRDDAKAAWHQIKTTGWFDGYNDVGAEQEGQWNQTVNQMYAEFVKLNARKPSPKERRVILQESVATFNAQIGGEALAPSVDVPLSPGTTQRLRDAIKAQGGDPNDPETMREMREILGL